MNDDQLLAARLLIEFSREIAYNDLRFAPSDINKAAETVADYLDNQ